MFLKYPMIGEKESDNICIVLLPQTDLINLLVPFIGHWSFRSCCYHLLLSLLINACANMYINMYMYVYMCYHRKTFYRNINRFTLQTLNSLTLIKNMLHSNCFVNFNIVKILSKPLILLKFFKTVYNSSHMRLNFGYLLYIFKALWLAFTGKTVILNWIDSLASKNFLFIQYLTNNQEHVQTSS